MIVTYLDLADFLIIAEAVLGSPADQVALQTKLALADSVPHAPAARSSIPISPPKRQGSVPIS